MIQLDFVGTLAAAGLVLFAGYAIQRRVVRAVAPQHPGPGRRRAAGRASRSRRSAPPGHEAVRFDTTLQAPLMIAFFTSIGFGASVPLLRAGGPAVAVFLALSTAVAVLQNLVGAGGRGGARRAAAARRPRRVGHAHRRPGHGARLRAALRAGGRDRRGLARGRRGDGGHRRRRDRRRADRHAPDRAARGCGPRRARAARRPAADVSAGDLVLAREPADPAPAGRGRRRSRRARDPEGRREPARRHGRRLVDQRRLHGARRDAARLHRRDAGRGGAAEPRRRHRLDPPAPPPARRPRQRGARALHRDGAHDAEAVGDREPGAAAGGDPAGRRWRSSRSSRSAWWPG